MGKVTKTIEIEATPEKVFAFFTSDKILDSWKDWVEVKWTSEKPIGLGSTMHAVGVGTGEKGGEWNGEVTEFTKDKSMTVVSKGANKKSVSTDQTYYYALEPTTKGTRVTFTFEYGMPYSILGELLDALVGKSRARGIVSKMLERWKKALEA